MRDTLPLALTDSANAAMAASRVEMLLCAVAETGRLMVKAEELRAGLIAATRALGELTDFDRAYVFQFDPAAECYHLIADWARPPWAPFATDPMWQCLRVADFLEIHTEFAAGRVWKSHQPERTGSNAAINGAAQTKSDALVPVFVQGALWGCVGFDRCTAIRDFSDGELDVLRTAAAVIAAAVERERAEQDKIEAVAREREHAAQQRTDELVKANVALRATLTQLASQPDHKAFLGAVLVEASRQLNADAGHLAIIDEDQGQVVTVAHSSGDQLLPLGKFPEVVPISKVIALPAMEAAGGPRNFDLNTEQHLFMQGTLEWHQQFGSRTVLTVPMILGKKIVGFLGFAFRRETVLSPEKSELMMALAQQAALATELIRMSQKEQLAAIASERAHAAKKRADEMERASLALQKTIDEVSKLQSLADFIPRALRIVAEAFGLGSAGFFEHPGDTIYLRYWLFENKIYGPQELPGLDSTRYELMSQMAAGFTVPVDHLGVHYRARSRPSIVHHQTATATPALHEFCRMMEWGWELNVPLMVDGHADGAITLFRPEEKPFTEADFSLAESLAKQIALAMQTSKIAERERELAIARAQEQAALQNAAELSTANEALRLAAERLDGLSDLDSFFDELVRAGADIVGAASGGIGLLEPDGMSLRIIAFVSGTPVGGKLTGSLVQLEGPVLLAWNEILSAKGYWWAAPEHPGFTPEMRAMHQSLGHRQIAHLALRIKDEVIGFIGLTFKTEVRPTESKLDLLRVLARQASVAVQLINLSSRERAAAIAREREQAAQERAEELAKANEALQATVDATSRVVELDKLVPKVLGIIANVFGTENCAIFENLPSGEIRLWYWHAEGRTLLPAELLQLDEEKHSLVRRLAAGFTAAPDYLGQDSRKAGTVFLDHVKGTSVPEFDQWAVSIGCDLELNIGIASHGVRCATLCIYRPRGRTFSPREMVLAGALARQIGLALQVTKLSQTNLEAAVAREREQAAQQRADELAKANGLLRRVNERLAHETNYRAVLGLLLAEITELVGNDAAAVFTYDEGIQSLRFLMGFDNGGIVSELAGHPYGHPDRPVDVRLFSPWPELVRSREQQFVRMSTDSAAPPSNEWHHERGHRLLVQAALVANGEPLGLLGLAFTSDEPVDPSKVEFFNAVAQQATLALQLSRQAERAEQAVVAREREQAAEQRAVELASANRALKETLDVLATEPDITMSLGHVLRVITEQLRACSSAVWLNARDSDESFCNLIYHEGEIVTPGSAHPAAKAWPHRRDLAWKAHIKQRRPVVYDLESTDDINPQRREMLRRLGVKTLLGVPLLLGDKAVGSFTVRFLEKRDFSPQQLELAQALAHQATLAFQLTRLSELAEKKAEETATLAERNRLARDIHDTLAQGFTGVIIQLEAAKGVALPAVSVEIIAHIDRAVELARASLSEARRSVRALRSVALRDTNLCAAIESLLKQMTLGTTLQAEVQTVGEKCALPPEVEDTLLRITQESLTNALKYAKARRFTARLAMSESAVELQLSDDGSGFELQKEHEGFGLLGMKERVASVGGVLAVRSQRGLGTEIVATISNSPTAV